VEEGRLVEDVHADGHAAVKERREDGDDDTARRRRAALLQQLQQRAGAAARRVEVVIRPCAVGAAGGLGRLDLRRAEGG
jgi:hypothetical protein